MATIKTENYSVEQTAELKAAYVAVRELGEDARKAVVDTFAAKFGKGARSIVAKLSREGVYVAKTYTAKTGEKPVKKDAHADAIGAILGMNENDTSSLAKANKTALVKIFSALANSKPLANGEGPEDSAD